MQTRSKKGVNVSKDVPEAISLSAVAASVAAVAKVRAKKGVDIEAQMQERKKKRCFKSSGRRNCD